MTFDQGRLRDVETGSGRSDRGAWRERCDRQAACWAETALSGASDRPSGPVQARSRPPDAVQRQPTGLLFPRKCASRRSIWGMPDKTKQSWTLEVEHDALLKKT